MIPSLFPIFDCTSNMIHDGSEVPLSGLCKNYFCSKRECLQHYEELISKNKSGLVPYTECPFGFTSQVFTYEDKQYVITGVIASPRFGSEVERKAAKACSSVYRVSRQSIDNFLKYLKEIESLRADVIEDASKVLPQAFHELRKLNGAVMQHAERELKKGDSRSLLSIKAAAELMKNNFDILEALSNIEGIRALPLDSTINLFDLSFKMKRVFQEKMEEKGVSLYVSGDRAIVNGSQKSFPIVPAVLIENAIKYGLRDSRIDLEIAANDKTVSMIVRNTTQEKINPAKCFERGVRFSREVEGGGFGLYLAREVIKCHQGQISCKVKDGVVEMIVDLPIFRTIPHKLNY